MEDPQYYVEKPSTEPGWDKLHESAKWLVKNDFASLWRSHEGELYIRLEKDARRLHYHIFKYLKDEEERQKKETRP